MYSFSRLFRLPHIREMDGTHHRLALQYRRFSVVDTRTVMPYRDILVLLGWKDSNLHYDPK